MKITRCVLLTCLIIALASCGTTRSRYASPNHDLAVVKLSESANTVSQSLVELARIQAVATPPVRENLPDPESYGMKEFGSLDWSGPIGPAVEQIAEAGNYRLRILGHPPAVPIVVTVIAKNVPLGILLRDIAFQAGNKANVSVYSRNRVIELRYARA